MVEGRYRRCHPAGGPMMRGGRRWNQTPYQRFQPPPGKMFYPPNPNVSFIHHLPPFIPEMRGPAPNCAPIFAHRPPPFLPPPPEVMPAVPRYTNVKLSLPNPIPIPPCMNKPNPPQFHAQYEEFENMKRNGMVLSPTGLVDKGEHKLLESPTESPNSDTFTSAMKLFMQSYMPTASFSNSKPGNFNSSKAVKDWSKEAVDLLEEISTTKNDTPKSVWNIPSTDKFKSPQGKRLSVDYELDIMRHIQDIKPSPYPGGSPLSKSSGSNVNSDNDADDETTPFGSPISQGGWKSTNQAIGTKRRKKQHSPFHKPHVDSGYQSSSTECGSIIGRALNALKSDLANADSDAGSESGFTSSSSRPSSPVQNPHLNLPKICMPQMHTQPAFRPITIPPPPTSFIPRVPSLPIPGISFVNPLPCEIKPIGQQITGATSDGGSAESDSGLYYKHKAWITDEILGMIAVRDRLYRRMKKHPAPDIVEMYKKIRNMVVGMTRNAKRAYEKKIEDKRMHRQLQSECLQAANPFHFPDPACIPVSLPYPNVPVGMTYSDIK